MNDRNRRTSGAKALIDAAYYGTAKAVPFVQIFFAAFACRRQSLCNEFGFSR
ncbi:MAG: hypothetical protein QOH35_4743 [Acidobacteriaceae bacterium]|jgi:hypothetical protein|nr:hypothetical protein [Acidobacteriaceae bacterium]MEA2259808.1 hypothetical protein [Acidobacteriaceae bacterium]MEA2543377.1 hypothetical protein [Acidobacteriaceae bacterium]